MAGDTVREIKDRLSIVDVVSQYVKLERSGASLRARCPFHSEKSPSFFVSPERGTYHCFGCGEGGDIFSFVEKVEGLDFKGALKVLADKAGVEISYERANKGEKDERDRLFELMEAATIFYASRLSEEARKYLRERGLTDATIKEFRLGLAGDAWSDLSDYLKGKKFTDKEILDAGLAKKTERGSLVDKFRNRIMFPIGDSAGRIVGFSGRVFGEKASPDAPKYLNSPETPLYHKSRILYGFDKGKQSIRKLNCAILVEGQVDLLASHQAGWTNAVAASGTAFTPEHAVLIKRMTENLIVALDADEAGLKAAIRAARAALASGLNVKVAKLPQGLDPADLVLQQGPDAWKEAIKSSQDIIAFLLDALYERAPQPDRFRRNVEAVVLPFLADVKSPIAREQYVQEIARRLGVSEAAVTSALSNVPLAPEPPVHQEEEAVRTSPSKDLGRAKQAYALALWQGALPKPQFDVRAFTVELEDAIGAEEYRLLTALTDEEKEALRFSAERLYGESRQLETETKTLLHNLLRDRFAREHAEAARALKQAEKEGNESEIERLLGVNKLLTTRIAQLHKKS